MDVIDYQNSQRRLRSHCEDAQADMGFHCPYMTLRNFFLTLRVKCALQQGESFVMLNSNNEDQTQLVHEFILTKIQEFLILPSSPDCKRTHMRRLIRVFSGLMTEGRISKIAIYCILTCPKM